MIIHDGGSLSCSPAPIQIPNSISFVIEHSEIDGVPSAPHGMLDLSDNGVVITDDRPQVLSELRAMLRAGATTGRGITSSRVNAQVSLGYARAAPLDGSSADFGNGVVIRETAPGDANLDGFVTKPDYFSVIHSFGHTDAFWSSGDFNYDGLVDTIDYNDLIANLSPRSVRDILAD